MGYARLFYLLFPMSPFLFIIFVFSITLQNPCLSCINTICLLACAKNKAELLKLETETEFAKSKI